MFKTFQIMSLFFVFMYNSTSITHASDSPGIGQKAQEAAACTRLLPSSNGEDVGDKCMKLLGTNPNALKRHPQFAAAMYDACNAPIGRYTSKFPTSEHCQIVYTYFAQTEFCTKEARKTAEGNNKCVKYLKKHGLDE